ncbi:MAG: exported protein of unknown function [Candidatus Saccharibacteria bacterium]|nr:exported protein of unknown function [Candidatus Saccharibacteria bacterium]
MYYELIQRNKRRIVIVCVVIFALIIGGAIYTYAIRQGKTGVVVSAVPSDAQITFNGQSEGNGTDWVKDGSYTVTAKKDGYQTLTKTVLVSGDKPQNVVALSLTASSDDAKKWANNHADDYQKNEEYGAIEANVNGQYFSSLNPITSKLPFQDPYFTIGYITNNDNVSITLTITTPSPRYRFYAVEKIRQLGYDPTDFKIVFKDFKNPLVTGVKK